MFEISKRFSFSAAHQLRGLPPDHPCGRVHGHNYEIEVKLISPYVNAVGFVLDYRDLGFVKELLDTVMDHRSLNDVPGLVQPSAENLAFWLHTEIARQLGVYYKVFVFGNEKLRLAIGVSETPKTWAWYSN